MKQVLLTLIVLIGVVFSIAQVPRVSNGTIRRYENFSSKNVRPRNIDVWLPDGYDPSRKYAVLYMHDGRSLFDSSIVWNLQEWGVDEVFGKLLSEKKLRDCIVVGIWNTEITRHNEYLPQKAFELLPPDQQDTVFKALRVGGQPVFSEYKIYSDNYLRFLVNELKPFIDSSFSTYKDQKNTFIGGSSMGGLISLYAICEYPKVFGGAACLSTHWTGIFRSVNNPFPSAMMKYLAIHLADPVDHKIYFDHGTATLDTLYKPYQQQADRIMRSKGYGPKNWTTKVFEEASHSERSWNERLDIPVLFLLGRK